MRIEKILKQLEADKLDLEEKYAQLNLHELFLNSNVDKTWGAIHCQGILTGYRFYLDRIAELRRLK